MVTRFVSVLTTQRYRQPTKTRPSGTSKFQQAIRMPLMHVRAGRVRGPQNGDRTVVVRADRERTRGSASMALEIVQPDSLDSPETYSHVIVATGARMVFIAGQMSDDPLGNLVHAGDLAAQARQVFANLGRALAAAGARPDQVARIGIYVVDHRQEHLSVIETARVALFCDHKPTDTLLGVRALAAPGYLIEVDAIAVID